MLLVASTLPAQRLGQLEPGTLVRITRSDGITLTGPLAEARSDSIFLSSTEKQPAVAIAAGSVTRYEFSRGKESRSGRGALLGAGVGLALAYLAGRNENSDFRIFSTTSGRVLTMALGLGLGAAITTSTAPPLWELPATAHAPSRMPFRPPFPSQLALVIRF